MPKYSSGAYDTNSRSTGLSSTKCWNTTRGIAQPHRRYRGLRTLCDNRIKSLGTRFFSNPCAKTPICAETPICAKTPMVTVTHRDASCVCIPHSFISFDCCLLLSICVFISLCVASVALALVFMPELYPTAYRATFPAFFYAVASSLFLLSACVFLFVFSILSRRCPLVATFLSVPFCLLSLLTSDSRFDLVWFRLSCDHGWIRSGSVNVRKTTTTTTLPLITRDTKTNSDY